MQKMHITLPRQNPDFFPTKFGRVADGLRTGVILKPRLFSCYNAIAVTRRAFGITPEYLELASQLVQQQLHRLAYFFGLGGF